MPILIVNNLEQPQGLVLGERALIGRRPFNTITIPDPDVSRIHAWIGRRGAGYVIFDAGSRGGTLVNAQRLKSSHRLEDGDEIRIGPATLVYHIADELPADVVPLDSPPAPPAADPYDGGIYFDCTCGGPMWVGADFAGKVGKCRYCGERLVVPHVSGQMARHVNPPVAKSAGSRANRAPAMPSAPASSSPPSPSRSRVRPPGPPEFQPSPPRRSAPPEFRPAPAPPVAPAPVSQPAAAATVAQSVTATRPAAKAPAPEEATPQSQPALCSICQAEILPTEQRTACPSCHLTFHAQCWEENYGCSAYGCDQVNVLARAQAAPDAPTAPDSQPTPQYDSQALAPPGLPWEPVLLALSFVAMALGALAFGIPSAVILVGVIIFLVLKKPQRKSLLIAALVVAVVGGIAGYATSMFWWKGVRVWETIRK